MELSLDKVSDAVLWTLVGIAVIAVLVALVIKKIIGRIIVLVLAAAVIFFGWQQRQHVIDVADDLRGQACAQQPEFLGITVQLPDGWCDRTAA